MLELVLGPVTHSGKLGPQAILALGFIAIGIAWSGMFLGLITGYLGLIAEKILADHSKPS